MPITSSPNMNMPVPVVGSEAGPQYATDINSCLSILDSHDHSAGLGVQITPSGLNINANLSMQDNNLTTVKSVQFVVQNPLLTDLGIVYVNGVDLYYNDVNGNQIQITDNGGVAGTPGSIANLVSPASASYVAINETFVWQSNANVAANMDFRSAILRNSTVSSFGLTLQAPTLSGDATQTLPQVPVATAFMTMDASGAMGVSIPIALGITASMLASDSVTTPKILDRNVTNSKNANNTTSVSTTYAILTTDDNVLVDTSGGSNVTVTLPTAVGNRLKFTIKKTTSDAKHVIIATTSAQTIDSIASGNIKLTALNDSITVQSDGTNYVVLARYLVPIYGIRARPSNQSIPNDTPTLVITNASVDALNVGSSGSQLDILYDGFYEITGNICYESNGAGYRAVFLYVSGIPKSGCMVSGQASHSTFTSASLVVGLVAGDYIELYTQQNSSGSLNLDASVSPYPNSISVRRVAPAGTL